MKKNPWKTLSKRIIYSNPWLTLREDSVIRPDGSEGIYGVVDTRIATGTIAVDSDENIYMVGQYRYPTEMYSWEIIEGGAENDEHPLDAAKRELKEEAGITASEWIQLGPEFHLSNCFSSEKAVVYLARSLKIGIPSPDVTEVLAVKKIPFSEAIKMVESGEVVDAVSIVGLERARRYLDK